MKKAHSCHTHHCNGSQHDSQLVRITRSAKTRCNVRRKACAILDLEDGLTVAATVAHVGLSDQWIRETIHRLDETGYKGLYRRRPATSKGKIIPSHNTTERRNAVPARRSRHYTGVARATKGEKFTQLRLF